MVATAVNGSWSIEPPASRVAQRYALVWGDYIDELVCHVDRTATGSPKYFATSNHLYSVAALTDSTKAVVERYRYDAYGKRTVYAANGTTVRTKSSYGQQTGFTGRYHDTETGLQYFRNRLYSMTLGRFVNRDSVGYYERMNMYGAWFIPSAVDPMGLYTWTASFRTSERIADAWGLLNVAGSAAAGQDYNLATYNFAVNFSADPDSGNIIDDGNHIRGNPTNVYRGPSGSLDFTTTWNGQGGIPVMKGKFGMKVAFSAGTVSPTASMTVAASPLGAKCLRVSIAMALARTKWSGAIDFNLPFSINAGPLTLDSDTLKSMLRLLNVPLSDSGKDYTSNIAWEFDLCVCECYKPVFPGDKNTRTAAWGGPKSTGSTQGPQLNGGPNVAGYPAWRGEYLSGNNCDKDKDGNPVAYSAPTTTTWSANVPAAPSAGGGRGAQ